MGADLLSDCFKNLLELAEGRELAEVGGVVRGGDRGVGELGLPRVGESALSGASTKSANPMVKADPCELSILYFSHYIYFYILYCQ